MDVMARKNALRRRGIFQTDIAKGCGVDQGLVSCVLAETKHGPKARMVMEYIASQLNLPVEIVFPNYERRRAA